MAVATLPPDVSRDRSLDEFSGGAGDPGGTDGTDDGGSDADADRGGADPPADDAVTADGPDCATPAVPTHAWSPDGAACSACGESAATRWRQAGEYVCPDCKEW